MKTALSTTNLIAAAVIGGAFAAGYFTGPAFAGEPQERRTIPFAFDFAFSPDELTSTSKAEDLVARLERRVRTHCGANLKMPVAQRQGAMACVEETMKTSISRFGSEAVAQAYKSLAAG
jgi:UrcA family protein